MLQVKSSSNVFKDAMNQGRPPLTWWCVTDTFVFRLQSYMQLLKFQTAQSNSDFSPQRTAYLCMFMYNLAEFVDYWNHVQYIRYLSGALQMSCVPNTYHITFISVACLSNHLIVDYTKGSLYTKNFLFRKITGLKWISIQHTEEEIIHIFQVDQPGHKIRRGTGSSSPIWISPPTPFQNWSLGDRWACWFWSQSDAQRQRFQGKLQPSRFWTVKRKLRSSHGENNWQGKKILHD